MGAAEAVIWKASAAVGLASQRRTAIEPRWRVMVQRVELE